jgi:two-component system, NtrC family, response regulator
MTAPWDVLVLSQQAESRRALCTMLQRQGISTLSAATLQECREAISQGKIGLVFSDRNLPDGTYQDLLEATRMLPRKVRVVITSEQADWDDYLEAIRLGAFDVIPAPCRRADVEWMLIQAKRDERTVATASTARDAA